jgi:NADH-quinone oxidoreductase subunit C
MEGGQVTDRPTTAEDAESSELSSLEQYASDLTDQLGAIGYDVEFDTVRVFVDPARWVETIVTAREELELFSWLSAIDWSKTTEVGEGVADPESLVERFEVLCRLSSVRNADAAIFVAELGRSEPSIASLTEAIGGAAWHEREAHEMFGIDFVGNEDLSHLYLTDEFVGNPLLKSYPLISREVKPWPGEVDVEPMPEPEPVPGDGGAS